MRRARADSRRLGWGAPLVRALRAPILAGGVIAIGCSGGPERAPVAPTPTASVAPSPASHDARSRLQGTWELVTFESLTPIPEEAVPVLAALHGAVRMRFDGSTVTTFLPGKVGEESCSYEISDEAGDSFTLVTGLGMFRRAQARFVSDDLWEATEKGPTWPGTTRFQRVKK